MIHCSGGAQTKILHFIDNLHIIKDNLFEVPPLFRIIQEQSGTSLAEMYKVFNMGHRMELYVPETIAEKLISISENFGIKAKVVGRCEKADTKKLTIGSENPIVYF
jgi:phosphoribosylformylglycinamidine cyclo-ligase